MFSLRSISNKLLPNKVISKFKNNFDKKFSTTAHNPVKNSCSNSCSNKTGNFETTSNPENKTCKDYNLEKLRLNYALVFFSIGGCVEIYTYYKSGNYSHSTGLVWGLLAALIILP